MRESIIAVGPFQILGHNLSLIACFSVRVFNFLAVHVPKSDWHIGACMCVCMCAGVHTHAHVLFSKGQTGATDHFKQWDIIFSPVEELGRHNFT